MNVWVMYIGFLNILRYERMHIWAHKRFSTEAKTDSKFCVAFTLYLENAWRKNDLQEKLCFVQHEKTMAFLNQGNGQ